MKGLFEKKLIQALSLDFPYADRPLRPKPPEGQRAAVLMLFGFEKRDLAEERPKLLLTRRAEFVEKHKGQMAFPGGVHETGEKFRDTALRETEEEVGIAPSRVKVLGELSSFPTLTGYTITPFVGITQSSIDEIELRINPNEIAHAFWITLEELSRKGIYRQEMYQIGQLKYPIHVYQIKEHRIWGATAVIIKNVLDRLQSLG